MSVEDFGKITTKSGDLGVSSNWSGRRIPKSDEFFDVLGDIDELSSWIGTVLKTRDNRFVAVNSERLTTIQNRLHDIMALVATDPDIDFSGVFHSEAYQALKPVTPLHIEEDLEDYQKDILKTVDIPSKFILPGGFIHQARTCCRRAERTIVKFMNHNKMRYDLNNSSRYLNRLSDLLFALATKYD
jgi:cob(I)alamin adenosyltransferase